MERRGGEDWRLQKKVWDCKTAETNENFWTIYLHCKLKGIQVAYCLMLSIDPGLILAINVHG